MSHDLSINKDGKAEMFSGEGIVCWHGLGTVVEGLLTAEKAIKAAKLDWKVGLRPVFVDESNPRKVDDYQAVERCDNQKVLSVVGSRYCPIQNEGAFDFFDEIVGSGKAIYTTAGALNEGRRVWIAAKIPGDLFLKNDPNDKIEKYVMLLNSHDGTASLTTQIVSIRPVCANTISMALRGASNVTKVRHTQNYKTKVDEAKRTLGLISGYYDNLQGVLDWMSEQEISKEGAEKFVEKLFPSTDEKTSTRTQNIRNEVVALFERGRGNHGKTRLDLFNGLTEFVSHSRSVRTSEGGNETESRMASVLLGSGAALVQRGYNMLAV